VSVDLPGLPAVRVPGDTVKIMVHATDDIAIGWIGWSAGPPLGGGDSVQTRGAHGASAMLEIPIPDAAVGTSAITVWARDCTDVVGRCDPAEKGNRTEVAIGMLEVAPLTPHIVYDLPLSGVAAATAYDATRRVMYFSMWDSSRIDVLSLTDRAWRSPIKLPDRPNGIDLVPGDDRLVVALYLVSEIPELGLVDLTLSSHPVTVVPLPANTMFDGASWDVKVTATRKVFVTFGTTLASYRYPVVEYDLDTGTIRPRNELGVFGQVADRTRIVRSFDRSRLLVVQLDLCCPVPGNVYDGATDTFAPERSFEAGDFLREISVDATGSAYLAGNVLYDRDLVPIAVADPVAYKGEFDWNTGQAIAPDAAVLYFATRYGYVALDGQTGAILERVHLPAPPSHLFVTPDGAQLVARTDRTSSTPARVYIVTLH
jgi:hypothetical protein